MESYFNHFFIADLRKLSLTRPNNVILSNPESFRIDQTTVFFGGRNWENYENDIKAIDQKSKFVLSLFATVCIDLTMFTHFSGSYAKFRSLTNYPKFGWSGYGPHFEGPHKLIIKAEQEGKLEFTDELIANFVLFWISSSKAFFSLHFPEIQFSYFFEKMRNDSDFIIGIQLSPTIKRIDQLLQKNS
jgi:hypothetical protein